jgi:hypothetical protein
MQRHGMLHTALPKGRAWVGQVGSGQGRVAAAVGAGHQVKGPCCKAHLLNYVKPLRQPRRPALTQAWAVYLPLARQRHGRPRDP